MYQSSDQTTRLIDLCTRRRLAWLDERRLWDKIYRLSDYDPSLGADYVARMKEAMVAAVIEWNTAKSMVEGLDAAIDLEVCAHRSMR